jgi:hypothetical protein
MTNENTNLGEVDFHLIHFFVKDSKSNFLSHLFQKYVLRPQMEAMVFKFIIIKIKINCNMWWISSSKKLIPSLIYQTNNHDRAHCVLLIEHISSNSNSNNCLRCRVVVVPALLLVVVVIVVLVAHQIKSTKVTNNRSGRGKGTKVKFGNFAARGGMVGK